MHNIILATGNKGKVREFGEMLVGKGLSLTSLADHWTPVPSIPETGDTFAENAVLKAQWVYERKKQWTLADDSGLEVDALEGRPGVKSARFAGETADSNANNRLLLELLATVPPQKRTARFRCVLVLMTGEKTCFTAEGSCEGFIGFEPRGSRGFGYDPLFLPAGYAPRTMAELDGAEKNVISHRGRALIKIRDYINEHLQ